MDIQRQVANAVQQAERSGLSAENAVDVAPANSAETVAKSVADTVSRQVAAQVSQQLMESGRALARTNCLRRGNAAADHGR